MKNKQIRIEIAGVLGAGKSTMASLVNPECTINEDFDSNPFLSYFYQEPTKYNFETELSFLLQHYHEIKKSSFQIQVCDFALVQDLAYGKMGLSPERFKIFKNVYQSIVDEINNPILIIYLKCNSEIILQRIRERNRQNERNINISFITTVQFYLDKEINLLAKHKHSKVIEFDTSMNNYIIEEVKKNELLISINSLIEKSL